MAGQGRRRPEGAGHHRLQRRRTKATETNAVGGVTEHVYFANRMLKTTKAPATTAGPKAVTDYRYEAAGWRSAPRPGHS